MKYDELDQVANKYLIGIRKNYLKTGIYKNHAAAQTTFRFCYVLQCKIVRRFHLIPTFSLHHLLGMVTLHFSPFYSVWENSISYRQKKGEIIKEWSPTDQ